MTRKKRRYQKERRERKFTTPETLAMHPVVKLFDNPRVLEVLSLRGDTALRFSDLQYLLCEEQPSTVPRNCPEIRGCIECPMFKKCLREVPGVWSRLFSRAELEEMKTYHSKPHLFDDLARLINEGYIRRVGRGRYEPSKSVQREHLAAALKKYLGRVTNECPIEFTHIDRSAYFLFLRMGLIEDYEQDFRKLCAQIEQVRRKLGELMMKSILNDVSKAFRKELSRLSDDREKVYLQRYLKDHISIQLANLGFEEERFKDDLSRIYKAELNINKSKLKRIEKEIEVEREMVREVKRKISEAFWLEQKRTPWAEKYESLMKKADEAPSKDEIERVKEVLRREEDFQKRFLDSDMCIRPDTLENSPFIVMEYSPFILPVGGSEEETGESESVRETAT